MEAQHKKSEDAQLENALLARVTEHDEAAFEQLYSIYFKRLQRFLYRMMGDDVGVQDVINDAMYVVWQKATTFDQSSKVSTWIFAIAVRTAKKYLSRQYKGALYEELEGGDQSDGSQWQRSLEGKDSLEKAMAQLSADQRAVVDLTYFQGLHYREVAEIMGCPENTVKTRMFHARTKLREALTDAEDV